VRIGRRRFIAATAIEKLIADSATSSNPADDPLHRAVASRGREVRIDPTQERFGA
jgi:hypothetical protein